MTPLFLVLSLSAAAPPDHEANPDIPAEVKKAFYATTRIQTDGSDARTASGVTIWTREEFAYVLTADHALGRKGECQVEFFHPDMYPNPEFVVLPSDVTVDRWPVADIALLKVLLPKKNGVTQTPTVVRLAAQLDRPKRFPVTVFTAGCDSSVKIEPPTLMETEIIGKRIRRTNNDLAIFWETKTSHEAGRSGGPMFDHRGRVIGICTANDTVTNHGFFTHLDEIQSWLKKNGHVEFFWESNR